MKKITMSLAAAAVGAALASAPASAAILDLGVLPVTPAGTSTNYGGVNSPGAFTSFVKFSFATSPTDASATYSDSVSFASQLVTGGLLKLFACAANCTGTGVAPVAAGAALATAAFVNFGTTTQLAAFGPVLGLNAGPYFLEISGSSPAAVTFAGTVSLSSAVPEPSTWAMMLIGFAGLAFATTRRRKGAVAAA